MLPGTILLEIFGFVAAILTTLSFLPQALRIRRQRSAADVSLAMYLMMVIGQALWLIYGFVLGPLTAIVTTLIFWLLLRGRYWNTA